MRTLVTGPVGLARCVLALDTGAAQTSLSPRILAAIGYDVNQLRGSTDITSATGTTSAPVFNLVPIMALGERLEVDVIGLQLPPGLNFQGLLGLDFFRDSALTIDFANGFIELNR